MFTVGDIGYLDADGYLFLCDRKSDMIISGGVNIYPAEIEAELSAHPAVDDVAVFGIPHEEWGEEIKAVVQPAPGAEPGPALTAELLAFLGGRAGPVQAAQEHRLRARAAPRPERQALQAPAPRPLLGRPRPLHLTPHPDPNPTRPGRRQAWLPGFLICDSQSGILCAAEWLIGDARAGDRGAV